MGSPWLGARSDRGKAASRAPEPVSCLPLDKSLPFPEPLFPHLSAGNDSGFRVLQSCGVQLLGARKARGAGLATGSNFHRLSAQHLTAV